MQAKTAMAGAQSLLAGFGMLRQKGLKRYVLIPLCINLLLFVGLFWWAGSGFESALDWLLPQLPSWLAWLAWLLWVLFALLLMLVMFFTFTLIANLIAAPFNGLLSARAELNLTGHLPVEAPAAGASGFLRTMGGALRDELRKLGYFAIWALLVALISLVLLFIPLLNVLIAPLWFGFGTWVMALEYADYPLGNRGLDFAEQRQHFRNNRWPALGFGAATMLASLIPVVNFIVMPAAVAGATLLWLPTAPIKDADQA